MNVRRLVVPAVLIGLFLVTACGSYSPYRPYSSYSGGFSSTPLSGGMQEVLFVGNRNLNETQAKYYARVRCAELTVLSGLKYFEIVDEKVTIKTEAESVSGSSSTTQENRPRPTRTGGISKTTTAVSESSSKLVTYEIPRCKVTFKALAKASEKCLDPRPLLLDAHGRGVPLANTTKLSLGIPIE